MSFAQVTSKVYKVIEDCTVDYHAADFITDPIMAEQHDGVRKIEGAIQSLRDLQSGLSGLQSTAMAEFLFDQRILKDGL